MNTKVESFLTRASCVTASSKQTAALDKKVIALWTSRFKEMGAQIISLKAGDGNTAVFNVKAPLKLKPLGVKYGLTSYFEIVPNGKTLDLVLDLSEEGAE